MAVYICPPLTYHKNNYKKTVIASEARKRMVSYYDLTNGKGRKNVETAHHPQKNTSKKTNKIRLRGHSFIFCVAKLASFFTYGICCNFSWFRCSCGRVLEGRARCGLGGFFRDFYLHLDLMGDFPNGLGLPVYANGFLLNKY